MDSNKRSIIRKLAAIAAIGFVGIPAGAGLIPTLEQFQEENGYGTEEVVEDTTEEVVEEVAMTSRWVLPNGTHNEKIVLSALQDRGITDKVALAVVLGNIKQESRFHSNICEGGARVNYHGCRYGGYGLIQWTTSDRYRGLGHYASRIGGDPSSVETQVGYIFRERQWLDIESSLKRNGHSVGYYMNRAYYWLGWGHHGARTHYSHDYAARLIFK
ncbi:hypothetical protein HOQ61_gp210 [Synechococcus phage ACG-2014f_Syn7803C7]|uniref:Phage tail lysozyme domain-containing protein n=1 Tax=Synechococcus phage ACG-2014f_Syn7803C7 TaxID=2790345 RepID=A0A0E3F2G4_9CAUD|nr:hypothetical protein HOQ61_gp210 [Synechococcus phage ACG-2014f_Syn7803C7]AIX20101.1 hypothetical protein Syn7803C7_210 [Synechococcus phage ACG-2014f_Syn7803C7]